MGAGLSPHAAARAAQAARAQDEGASALSPLCDLAGFKPAHSSDTVRAAVARVPAQALQHRHRCAEQCKHVSLCAPCPALHPGMSGGGALARAQVGWFLHTPFPSSEIYRTLPVREEVLRAVLKADLIGFHTYDYARHFVSACTRILGLEARSPAPRSPPGDRRAQCLPLWGWMRLVAVPAWCIVRSTARALL